MSAVSNHTYSIQYADTLGAGAWISLTNFSARATNRIEMVLDSTFAARRIYRVATPQQP